MQVQLDRFEDNDFAVLLPYPDGGRGFDVPRKVLPRDAAPGDVFTLSFERDAEESGRLDWENRRLTDELLGRGGA